MPELTPRPLADLSEIPELIANFFPFEGRTHRGAIFTILSASDESPSLLLGRDRDRFLADRPLIMYIVYSYGVPVAWKAADRGGLEVVTRDYGPCTSFKQLLPILRGQQILLARVTHPMTVMMVQAQAQREFDYRYQMYVERDDHWIQLHEGDTLLPGERVWFASDYSQSGPTNEEISANAAETQEAIQRHAAQEWVERHYAHLRPVMAPSVRSPEEGRPGHRWTVFRNDHQRTRTPQRNLWAEPVEDADGYIDGTYIDTWSNPGAPDASKPYPWDEIAEETARIEAAKPPLLDRIAALIGE